MASFNNVILMGNLTADPELRQTTTGVSVARFGIAVKRKFGEGTDFFDVVAWRGTAEFVCRYFCKGQAILVCGELQNSKFTDKAGNERTKTEIVADEVTFADTKPRNEAPPEIKPTYHAQNTEKFEEASDDGDLPF